MQGVMPVKIFREFGIDPDILGENRIWGLVNSLRDLIAKGLSFTNGRETQPNKSEANFIKDVEAEDRPDLELKELPKPPRQLKNPRVVIPTVSRDDLQRLFHQVAYLSQEMEFLKKIILAGKSEK